MSQHDTLTLEQLDQHLDAILKAAGSALRHYTMQKSRDDMRAALSAALSATQPDQAHWTEREPVRLASSRVGRVYIAGPMTGIEEFNFPAFNAEAAKLRGEGMAVLNPAEHGIVDGAEWADYLRHDIAGLASCERTHMLRGWEKSKGAQLEVTIAQALGMQITYQEGAEPAQAAQAAADARDAQPMIPLSMLRPIAVEAIRSITGCPDLSSGDRHLTDEIEAVAIAALATHQQGGSK